MKAKELIQVAVESIASAMKIQGRDFEVLGEAEFLEHDIAIVHVGVLSTDGTSVRTYSIKISLADDQEIL